ncbi:MAG: MATE family efflux transporter [Alphaproteobacteria bacterium]|nr:MATE family efflux transporter [Alphaproteobacteria bacterium]
MSRSNIVPFPTPHGARAWFAEARALARLAGPLILTQLAQMAIGTTDLLLLGRYSQTALAAAAIGNTIYFVGWLAGSGPASAISAMIAHALGARPRARGAVRRATRMGLWSVVITSAVMMPVLWSARPILLAFGQAPDLTLLAGQFCFILAFGLPFAVGYQALRNFATALGRPRAAMIVMLLTIGFNAAAGWVLIYGRYGAPRLGIVGSGLATAGSAVFSFLAMAGVIAVDGRLRAYRVWRRAHRPAADKLAEVFRLGLPISATMAFEMLLFSAMTLVMGRFGAAALAAHQIAMNVASITFMVPLGLGMAATVRVGLAAGGGDIARARQAGLVAFAMAAGFMALTGLFMMVFSHAIAGLYLAGAGAAAVAIQASLYLKLGAAFQVFDGIQTVGAQCLRGLKDTRIPMALAGGAYWLVGAPVSLGLAFGAGLKGAGVWLGFVAGLAAAAVLMAARFWILTRGRRRAASLELGETMGA